MRKTSLISLSRMAAASALVVFAGWVAQPAMAQGVVPGSIRTAPKGTAPGANAKGIKDDKMKSVPCTLCGKKPTERRKVKFKAGADLGKSLR